MIYRDVQGLCKSRWKFRCEIQKDEVYMYVLAVLVEGGTEVIVMSSSFNRRGLF